MQWMPRRMQSYTSFLSLTAVLERDAWSTPRPPQYPPPPERDPVIIIQEAGWVPGPVWAGAENLFPTGIWSPDRPARWVVTIPTELSRSTLFPSWAKLSLCSPSQIFQVTSNITLPSTPSSSKLSVSFKFLRQNALCTYCLPITCHMFRTFYLP